MTEATCNISVNPIEGERKVGSVGIPLPYTKIKIIKESAGSLLEMQNWKVDWRDLCRKPWCCCWKPYTDAEKNKIFITKKIFLEQVI